MKTRRFDTFGKTVMVGSIGIGVLAGCSQESPAQRVPEQRAQSVTNETGTSASPSQTLEASPSPAQESILSRLPEGMGELNWCGYEAARIAITDILSSENTKDYGDGFFKNEHGTAKAEKTSIGYVYSVDATVGDEHALAVRGEWSLQSEKSSALAALSPEEFDRRSLRINQDAPIAVWNLTTNKGGTTNELESAEVCSVAEEVAQAIEK